MPVPQSYPDSKKRIQEIKKENINIFSMCGGPTGKMRVLTMPSTTFTCYRHCFSKYNWRSLYAMENNRELFKKMVDVIERRHYNLIAMHQDILSPNVLRVINPHIVDLDMCGCLTSDTTRKITQFISNKIINEESFLLFLTFCQRNGGVEEHDRLAYQELLNFLSKESSVKILHAISYRSLGPMLFTSIMRIGENDMTTYAERAKKAWETRRVNEKKKNKGTHERSKRAWVTRKKRYGPTGTPPSNK